MLGLFPNVQQMFPYDELSVSSCLHYQLKHSDFRGVIYTMINLVYFFCAESRSNNFLPVELIPFTSRSVFSAHIYSRYNLWNINSLMLNITSDDLR